MASHQVQTGQGEGDPVSKRPAADIASSGRPGFWLPVWTLWWRELVRFYRQRGRVLGALGTPLMFWLLIGAGFGDSFRASGAAGAGMSYLEYLFPGTVLLIVLFTSIFSNISVIEDRREGFLLSVLAAPISRTAVVLGKVLGGSTLALLQGLVLVALAPLVGIRLEARQALEVIGILFLISFAMTALGFYFAWRLDSVQGFHSVMNLVLMPMWLLSGALFPAAGAHSWVGWVMRLNPMTYGMAALRRVLYSAPSHDTPALGWSVGVMALFGCLAALAGLWEVNRPSPGGSA